VLKSIVSKQLTDFDGLKNIDVKKTKICTAQILYLKPFEHFKDVLLYRKEQLTLDKFKSLVESFKNYRVQRVPRHH
jgi:hypothetical protein